MALKKKSEEFLHNINLQMDNILKNNVDKNRNTASSVEKGDAFAKYYVDEILKPQYSLTDDEIAEGLRIGGGNDLDIDFIYENEDAYIIVQAKYRDFDDRIEKKDISYFGALVGRIFNEETSKIANRELKEWLIDIRENRNKKMLKLEFVYTKDFTDSLETEIDVAKSSTYNAAKEYDILTPEIVFYDIDALRQLYQSTLVIEQKGITTIYLSKFEDKLLYPNDERKAVAWVNMASIIKGDFETIMMPIKASNLVAIYKNKRNALFNENIRAYLGNNKVNKQIQETLTNHPDRFFIYNNGISGICDEINYHKKHNNLEVSNFQIINGAQTTKSLFDVYLNNPSLLQDVYILLKLTKTKDATLKTSITKYNNSQTAVKNSDFRANDPIQLFLNREIGKHKYLGEGKRINIMYLNKRQVKDNKCKCITLEELAKIIAAVELGPTESSKTTSLFDETKTGKYFHIFGEDGLEIDYFSSERLNKVLAIINVWFHLEVIRKNKIKKDYPPKSEARNDESYLAHLTRFHILWTYFKLIEQLYSEKIENIYHNIAEGKVFDSKNNFIELWFDLIIDKINTVLSLTPGLNFRNWQRNPEQSTKILEKTYRTLKENNFPLTKEMQSK